MGGKDFHSFFFPPTIHMLKYVYIGCRDELQTYIKVSFCLVYVSSWFTDPGCYWCGWGERTVASFWTACWRKCRFFWIMLLITFLNDFSRDFPSSPAVKIPHFHRRTGSLRCRMPCDVAKKKIFKRIVLNFFLLFCLSVCISTIKKMGVESSFLMSSFLYVSTPFFPMIRVASFLSLGPRAAKMSFRRWKCLTPSAPPSMCPISPQGSSCWRLWRWGWGSGVRTAQRKELRVPQASHLVFSFCVNTEHGTQGTPPVTFRNWRKKRNTSESEAILHSSVEAARKLPGVNYSAPSMTNACRLLGQKLWRGEGSKIINI